MGGGGGGGEGGGGGLIFLCALRVVFISISSEKLTPWVYSVSRTQACFWVLVKSNSRRCPLRASRF